MTRWWTVIGAVVALLLIAVAVVVWQQSQGPQSRIDAALATMPDDVQIASFTDWRAARDNIADVSSDSTVHERADFFDAAYERDFSTLSLLATYEDAMTRTYGWSVLDLEWEMYGQGREGAVAVLKVPDGFDYAEADATLTELGYPEPGDDGVRAGGPDLMAAIEPGLTPQLGYLVLLPDEHLIIASDNAAYAAWTATIAEGDADSLYDSDDVTAMSDVLGESAVATVVSIGPRACIVSGFGDAAPAERKLARQRISDVGGINPLTVQALATDTRGRLAVVMGFESSDQADQDVIARQELATGEAPDQGGTFEERFTVTKAEVADETVLLQLTPTSDDAQLLSDFNRGGLLFASC